MKATGVLGGFNDKEHRYFWRVPDRVGNVFLDIIRGFNEHRRNFGLWRIFGSRDTRLTLKNLEREFLGAVLDIFHSNKKINIRQEPNLEQVLGFRTIRSPEVLLKTMRLWTWSQSCFDESVSCFTFSFFSIEIHTRLQVSRWSSG